eukprot:m.940952 g.940952  ORF g.940952 m.940952 type:complete len:135 (-) comp23831_c0_seq2:2923-3327(-)
MHVAAENNAASFQLGIAVASFAAIAIAAITQHLVDFSENDKTAHLSQTSGSGIGAWIVTIFAAAGLLWMCIYVRSISGVDGLFETLQSTQLQDMVRETEQRRHVSSREFSAAATAGDRLLQTAGRIRTAQAALR